MDTQQRAQMAMSLRDNEVLQEAFSALRSNALEALAKADPTDADGIRQYQATIAVVDELREHLDGLIRSGAVKKPAGIA